MKKFFIILITLQVVSGVEAQESFPILSYKYSAVPSRFESIAIQYPNSVSEGNIMSNISNSNNGLSCIHSETDLFAAAIEHQIQQQRSLVQLYDSIYEWEWDKTRIGWVKVAKRTNIHYDFNYNLLSLVIQLWSGYSWEIKYKVNFSYDADNRLISILDQGWDNNNWYNTLLYTYTYDSNDNETNYLVQEWQWFGDYWENIHQHIFKYDTNNNLTNEIEQIWYDSVWSNISQNIYTYNTSNYLLTKLNQFWNDFVWGNSNLNFYTYNTNNYLTTVLSQLWNGSSWQKNSQEILSYDNDNNLVNKLIQSWNGTVWENYELIIYTYNTNNYLTTVLSQLWNGSSWQKYSQEIFTYDANNFEKSYSFRYFWPSITVESGDSTHNYFHTVLSLDDYVSPSLGIKIYPIPSSDQITIELPETTTPIKNTYMTIYNLNGQQLLRRQITEPQNVVDVSGLNAGIYFVKVTDERTFMVGKFVKE